MSRLRITGGAARGRWLPAPTGRAVRPTSSRVREAVFSVLGQELGGLRFLDACCGSGIMAAEAWSRGAAVTALEKDGTRARALQQLLADLGADVTVLRRDARRPPDGTWHIAFIDPPYKLDPLPFVAALSGRVEHVIVEAESRRECPERVEDFERVKVRRFGDSSLWEFHPAG